MYGMLAENKHNLFKNVPDLENKNILVPLLEEMVQLRRYTWQRFSDMFCLIFEIYK